jgi:predicted permease
MLPELFGIIAPVFVCAALGFGWARAGRAYDGNVISELISWIGAPCLVFSSLSALVVEPRAMAEMAAGMLAAIGVFVVLGAVVLRLAGLPAHTFLAPLVFTNAGNMGLPLSLFAFGSEGLALAVCGFAVMAITHFTAGVWIWSGRPSLRPFFATPLTWAAVAAVVVLVTGAPVPGWIRNTTELLGGFTIPLMLLTLGVSLSELHPSGLLRSTALSVLRLGMGFAVGIAVAQVLGLEGTARGVLVLQCAMPAAVFNYLFAQQFGRAPEQVASLVVVSTAISFVTLPLLLGWLLV